MASGANVPPISFWTICEIISTAFPETTSPLFLLFRTVSISFAASLLPGSSGLSGGSISAPEVTLELCGSELDELELRGVEFEELEELELRGTELEELDELELRGAELEELEELELRGAELEELELWGLELEELEAVEL